jgi:aminocarboxymuconate-semialdehyde decarboxylase
MSNALQIVDFHNHYVGPGFPVATSAPFSGLLRDRGALLSSLEQGGVAARVLNTPLEFIRGAEGDVAPGMVERINDALAELVDGHPGRLHGLATVDGYAGDAAAAELTRAVRTLGLRGVFVESAKCNLLPDAPEARPTFAAAAALGVPVFLHPVADRALDLRFQRFGRLGVRLTRGTINAAALMAILQSGMFKELPGLRVVVTSLALGGVLLAAGTPEVDLRRVYIDTTGMHPSSIRAAIDVLGADHVVAGTDWPVVQEKSLASRLAQTLHSLSPEAQRMVARTNALGLLGMN